MMDDIAAYALIALQLAVLILLLVIAACLIKYGVYVFHLIPSA
ncbi:hypothetical protein [Sphingomonas sp.]|nr:hypothetical protein [Sphingomonas sp.]